MAEGLKVFKRKDRQDREGRAEGECLKESRIFRFFSGSFSGISRSSSGKALIFSGSCQGLFFVEGTGGFSDGNFLKIFLL